MQKDKNNSLLAVLRSGICMKTSVNRYTNPETRMRRYRVIINGIHTGARASGACNFQSNSRGKLFILRFVIFEK